MHATIIKQVLKTYQHQLWGFASKWETCPCVYNQADVCSKTLSSLPDCVVDIGLHS